MGAELSQMSLLYFLTYVAAAGNLKNLVEGTPYTAQEYKIKVVFLYGTGILNKGTFLTPSFGNHLFAHNLVLKHLLANI